MKDFHDRHVVVTGGTGALGSAVVAELLGRGAHCHVPCYAERELERWEFVGHPRVRLETGVDLSDDAAVAAFYGGVGDELWASVHVAGGFAMGPFADTSRDDLMKQLSMNALTCALCCRAALATMGPLGGRIVNVAAQPALEPRLGAGMVAYTTSKAAVAALTQALAEEVAARGVWVNAVVPSIMDTPTNRAAMPDAAHGDWPTCPHVAATIAFLASPNNASTRGALVPVYGRS